MVAGAAAELIRRRPRINRPEPPALRLVLMVLLVEIRSGSSVLAALNSAAGWLPEYQELQRASRVASVVGLASAIEGASPELRPVLVQLARAKRSGASLGSTVSRLIDDELAGERTARLARARSLPVRLMIPVTLLMLPGLILLLYAPALLRLLTDLAGSWS